jgi:hypothetical protein
LGVVAAADLPIGIRSAEEISQPEMPTAIRGTPVIRSSVVTTAFPLPS